MMMNAAQMKFAIELMGDVSLFVQDGHVLKEQSVQHKTTKNNVHAFLRFKEMGLCIALNVRKIFI